MTICSTASERCRCICSNRLHGDGRDRGQAMVDLKQIYERAGFEPPHPNFRTIFR